MLFNHYFNNNSMSVRSRTITISVKRKTGDVFEAILNLPPKMAPDAKKKEGNWWSFTTERGPAQLKFFDNKQLGILDYQYIDTEAKWDVPMRVIPSGDSSEILITLNKPEGMSEEVFQKRTKEMEQITQTMKQILETN